MDADGDVFDHVMRIVRGIQLDLWDDADVADTEVTEDGGWSQSPTAFISWAHAHSSWNDKQKADWQEQVATFAASLRHFGVDADVDLFHLDEPRDWTRYGARAINKSQFTLIVMSMAWAERWAGDNLPTEGAGAAAEADYLRGLFAKNQEAWQRRLLIVMFPGVQSAIVPPDLERISRVYVDPTNPDNYEAVLRNLTEQPRYPKPPLGVVPTLDTAGADSVAALRKRLAEVRREENSLGDTDRDEREQLSMKEAALRGFIDAADQEDG